MFITVVIKLMAPRIELNPERCNEKIAKSTDALGCPTNAESGG